MSGVALILFAFAQSSAAPCLQVRRLEYVICSEDPAWALDLLRSAAPTLEELHVVHPREEHLLAVHAMPRLQRLALDCYDDFLDDRPPVLPALPRACSYKWLRVCNAPRPTLESLLQAHSAALDVLWLQAGTPGDGDGHFPNYFNDMDALLDHCGVRAARVLLWRSQSKHDLADCAVQVSAVRRVLPAATVQCCSCDEVPFEDF